MEHTIVVQFKTSDAEYFGTADELDWRHAREADLGDLLITQGLGMCDGGQAGAGSMEIFLFPVTDIPRAIEAIQEYLTDHEWIQFCKIVSLPEGADVWTVHYPQGAKFDVWQWVD